jgi:cell division protein FtsN
MLNKLNRWNYNAEIVEGGNLLRVSYESYNNREDAVLALNKIKQENSSAWLLTK